MNELANKGKIEHAVQLAIEVVFWHQVVQRDHRHWRDMPDFLSHHEQAPLWAIRQALKAVHIGT